MSICQQLFSVVEPFLGLVETSPRIWSFILAFLSLAWVVAMCFLGAGMYMVSCITHMTSRAISSYHNHCGGSWTDTEAHNILITGTSINIFILIVMVILVVQKKLERNELEEAPPDYESLIKAETPPPTYNEVKSEYQPVHVSEANETLAALADINACIADTTRTDYPSESSAEPTNKALSTLNIPTTFLSPSAPLIEVPCTGKVPKASETSMIALV